MGQRRWPLRGLGSVLIALVLALTACMSLGDSDQLSVARSRLHPVACDKEVAVSAVAGVNADSHLVYLGDWVLVSVCRLDELLKTADAAQAPITLFMEGMDTANAAVGIDAESGTLIFTLDRTGENRDLWRPFLYDPLFDRDVSIRVSVGVRGERPLPRAPGANLTLQLRKIYVDWTTWTWVLFLSVLGIALVVLALRTDMLREGPSVEGQRRPYSLGRTQMAWWFFLVVISYAFIWIVTGDRDTLSPSVLALMGISAATALVAEALGTGQAEEAMRPSRGLWHDLVSNDAGSVALDRLQILVWTLVLGFVFLTSVLWELTMPEFNATLLALMGVSSGTYIGFQLPTKTSSG